jgi:hypothetical protein
VDATRRGGLAGFARPKPIAATVATAAISRRSLIDAPRSLSIISLSIGVFHLGGPSAA